MLYFHLSLFTILIALPIVVLACVLSITTCLIRRIARANGTNPSRKSIRFLSWPLSLPPAILFYCVFAGAAVRFFFPDLTPEQRTALRKIEIGMTPAQVVEVAGRPSLREEWHDVKPWWQYTNGFDDGQWNVKFHDGRVIESYWTSAR